MAARGKPTAPPLPVGHGQRLCPRGKALPRLFLTAFVGQAPRRRGLHSLGPGKVSLPGPSLFRCGSSGAWDRGGYALSLRPCCPQALLSSVGVGAPATRSLLRRAWGQHGRKSRTHSPCPMPPEKGTLPFACSVGPTRAARFAQQRLLAAYGGSPRRKRAAVALG